MTISRGIQPGKCLLRKVPVDLLTFSYGNLILHYDSTSVTLYNCAVAEVRNRHQIMREGWLQDVILLDRRWKWKYCRIDGVYNERTPGYGVQPNNQRTIKQLIQLCLDALGEAGYDISACPTDVYPPVVWNAARADLELQWLCELIGMTVCFNTYTDTVYIKNLNDLYGADLPAIKYTTPVQRYKPSVIPAFLRVQGNPTIVQSTLALEAVGLDVDGSIVPIDDLSYKPAYGWEGEWPTLFEGVDADNRDLAFRSVFRWYRPTSGWDGDGVTINDASQLELLPYCAEGGDDED